MDANYVFDVSCHWVLHGIWPGARGPARGDAADPNQERRERIHQLLDERDGPGCNSSLPADGRTMGHIWGILVSWLQLLFAGSSVFCHGT